MLDQVNDFFGINPDIDLSIMRPYQALATMKSAYIILTNSGGVQKEAPALRKPVLVLCNETAYKTIARDVSTYGDDRAADRIVKTPRGYFA